jgi:LacI family transcriptional regulator
LATSRDRRDSFLDAVVKFGLSSQDSWIVPGDFKIAGGAIGVESILNQEMRPTAVVTANDLTAFGALRKIHEMGLRIPEDISLTGCDDIEMSDVVYPPLTTLRISRRQYAQMLFDALQLGASDPTQTGRVFSLPMKLVVRQSTGPAPSGDRRNYAGIGGKTTRRTR